MGSLYPEIDSAKSSPPSGGKTLGREAGTFVVQIPELAPFGGFSVFWDRVIAIDMCEKRRVRGGRS
ncbi:hypothetical protein MOKP76_05910 [Mycobacterium avium subsp. hominissuis]